MRAGEVMEEFNVPAQSSVGMPMMCMVVNAGITSVKFADDVHTAPVAEPWMVVRTTLSMCPVTRFTAGGEKQWVDQAPVVE